MFLKRACDIACALAALAVLILPMAVVALAVRLTSRGPALFNQDDLVAARTAWNIHLLPSEVAGGAQANGFDELQSPTRWPWMRNIYDA